MSKYARGHRVYIVEYRGFQKIGTAPSIFTIEREYYIAPLTARIFQLLIAKVAGYSWRVLFALSRFIYFTLRAIDNLTKRLTWISMRTPSTIKYLSVPMEQKTAKKVVREMHKKLDSLYGKENYSSGWCEISKFNIGFLKRWVIDATLEK